MENRKVILYISTSVDGFIATEDDDLSWLSVVQGSGEDYGYHELEKQIDTDRKSTRLNSSHYS
mgnify:CR=1 FL=1